MYPSRRKRRSVLETLRTGGFPIPPPGPPAGPLAVLDVAQDGGNEELYNISLSGSKLSSQIDITDTTPDTVAVLTYRVYDAQGGTLLYAFQVAPDADMTNIGDYTYLAGEGTSRDLAEFTAEFVGNITTGSGVLFTLNKRDWAQGSGFVDDGINGNDPSLPTDLYFQVDILDVETSLSTLSNVDFADIKIRRGGINLSIYMSLDPDGNLAIADYSNHAVRIVKPGGTYTRLLRTMAGPEPPTISFGNVPTVAGEASPGGSGRFNLTEGIDWFIPGGKTNGYYDLYFTDRTNKRLRRITRVATTVDDRNSWIVINEDYTVTWSFFPISLDPVRSANGKPIIWAGDMGLLCINYDGANWVETLIDIVNFPNDVSRISVDQNGSLVINHTKADGVTFRLSYLQFTGGDYLNPANWSYFGYLDEGFGGQPAYCNTIIGYDVTYNFPIILGTTRNTGEIHRYQYNGGVSGTSADWDKTTVATIPGTGTIRGFDIKYDATNDYCLVLGGTYREIYILNLTTYELTNFTGKFGITEYENDIVY